MFDYFQAQTKARECFANMRREEKGVGKKNYTVDDALDAYYEYLKRNKKTADRARFAINGLIRPVFGKIKAVDLSYKQISAWHRKLAEEKPRLRVKPGKAQRYKDLEETLADFIENNMPRLPVLAFPDIERSRIPVIVMRFQRNKFPISATRKKCGLHKPFELAFAGID